MAVRAHGAKILHGVQLICLTDLPKRLEVVDVDETLAEYSVHLLEVKAADTADDSPTFDALSPYRATAKTDPLATEVLTP